jgi:hypothetical protein
MTNCSSLFKLLMVTLVVAAFTPMNVDADDAAERNERQFVELNEQMQQMRAEMEELRAVLRQMVEQRESVKPDVPPELQERLHAMKNQIQELMQAGRVDEANAVQREANALLERFVAAQSEEPSKDATEVALPPELAERLADMKREIQELRAAGRLDAAEALEREAIALHNEFAADAAAREQAVPQPPKDGAAPDARLDHLRAAADHLQAAGSLDLAERVRQQIEEMERDRSE